MPTLKAAVGYSIKPISINLPKILTLTTPPDTGTTWHKVITVVKIIRLQCLLADFNWTSHLVSELFTKLNSYSISSIVNFNLLIGMIYLPPPSGNRFRPWPKGSLAITGIGFWNSNYFLHFSNSWIFSLSCFNCLVSRYFFILFLRIKKLMKIKIDKGITT